MHHDLKHDLVVVSAYISISIAALTASLVAAVYWAVGVMGG